MQIQKIKSLCLLSTLTLVINSCKKLVEIAPPVGSITTSQVFSTDQQASSAMTDIYAKMVNNTGGGLYFSNGAITVNSGLSADELKMLKPNEELIQFQSNKISPSNSTLYSNMWGSAYFTIYQTNALIEGLQASTTIHDSVRNELMGEAKFIRAFCNFYLTNLFGDIPLVTTTNWRKTDLLARTSSREIYKSIVADLLDALDPAERDGVRRTNLVLVT